MSGEGSHSKYDGPDGPLPDLGPDDLDSILEHAGEGQSETPEASKETELEFKIGTRVNLLRSPRKKGDSRKLEFDWVVTGRFDEERPKHIVVGKTDEKGDYVATKAVNPNNL